MLNSWKAFLQVWNAPGELRAIRAAALPRIEGTSARQGESLAIGGVMSDPFAGL